MAETQNKFSHVGQCEDAEVGLRHYFHCQGSFARLLIFGGA